MVRDLYFIVKGEDLLEKW